MSNRPRLLVREISDQYSRENFIRLNDFYSQQTALLGFKHFEFTIVETGTQKLAHNLGITPKDVLVTSIRGSGTVVWNYGDFDRTNLNLTVSGSASVESPTIIRLYVGTHVQGDL
jgi:hypothetical protein